jgi:hypothetical protein
MESPEYRAARQRTPEEDDAVIEAEWRRVGFPAALEAHRQQAAFDADYAAYRRAWVEGGHA